MLSTAKMKESGYDSSKRVFFKKLFCRLWKGVGSFLMGANDRSLNIPLLGSEHYQLQKLGLRLWNPQRKICLPDHRIVHIPLWFHFISILSPERTRYANWNQNINKYSIPWYNPQRNENVQKRRSLWTLRLVEAGYKRV